MFITEAIIVVFLGMILGSFSSALIHRVPRNLSWKTKRSSCPSCSSVLGVVDLIPIVSWCMFRGKCRHCSNKISSIYPILEIVGAILCLGVYLAFGLNVESLIVMASVPILIALFMIDLEHMILPNQLVFILFIIGVLRLMYLCIYEASLQIGDLLSNYILGAVIFAFISWFLGFVLTKILKRDSLGFGDVKFFLVAGLWLGIFLLPYFMIISGVVAILFALTWRAVKGQSIFPFGPSLIVAFYSLLLFGDYLGQLGI